MTPHQKQVLKVWTPAGLWMVVIAIESTDYLSSFHTSRILYPIFHFLFNMDLRHFAVWHHLIRKTGHVVGYFIMSVLAFRAWRATLPAIQTWAAGWATMAFFMTALIASLDEWHQSYLPSRTGKVSDVVLDSAAAMGAQVVIYFYWRVKGRRSEAI